MTESGYSSLAIVYNRVLFHTRSIVPDITGTQRPPMKVAVTTPFGLAAASAAQF
jgi:hypothetical protein